MKLLIRRSKQTVSINPGTPCPVVFEFCGISIAMRAAEAIKLADELVDATEKLRQGRQ